MSNSNFFISGAHDDHESGCRICPFCRHNALGLKECHYPVLAQVQPIATCDTSLKPPLAVLHSGVYAIKLAQRVRTHCNKTTSLLPRMTLPLFHSNHQAEQVIQDHGAMCHTFFKSARDTGRFATNINALGQTAPEKSKKISVICAYLVYISIHKRSRSNGARQIKENVSNFCILGIHKRRVSENAIPLAQVQPIATSNTS